MGKGYRTPHQKKQAEIARANRRKDRLAAADLEKAKVQAGLIVTLLKSEKQNQNINAGEHHYPEVRPVPKPMGETMVDKATEELVKLSHIILSLLAFLATAANGFYGIFSSNYWIQILPFSACLCVLILFWTRRLSVLHKKQWFWFPASFVVIATVIGTVEVITKRVAESRTFEETRKQEHGMITTNMPNSLMSLQVGVGFLSNATYSKRQIPTNDVKMEWLPPELPEGCTNVLVTFGGNTAVRSRGQSGAIFQTGASETKEFVKDNRLYVNANITLNGTYTYKIDAMEFHGDMPPEWDRNFSPYAFEIVGKDHLPIFQEVYKIPEHVLLEGIFPSGDGGLVAVFEGYGMIANRDPTALLEMIRSRKSIFKYPSYQHRGEYAETNPLELDARESDPMQITERKRDMFIGCLHKAPKGPIWILSTNEASASWQFTREIRKLIDDAGYGVNGHPFPYNINGASSEGVFITTSANIRVSDASLVLVLTGEGKDIPLSQQVWRQGMQLENAFDFAGIKAAEDSVNIESSNMVIFIPDRR